MRAWPQLPLEPAVVPVGANVNSPARLIRARSGVVQYSARLGLLAKFEEWISREDAFAACLIGGRGGSGKTHLGVALCEIADRLEWVSGFLTATSDPAAHDALARLATGRLVVVDYAENRAEQLTTMLPALIARAHAGCPVRVVLLVRATPRVGDDWTAVMRHRSNPLDAALDDLQQWVLDTLPLDEEEQDALRDAAAAAFAARRSASAVPAPAASAQAPVDLPADLFKSPLMVVIDAFLAVHGSARPPSTRSELLEELRHHEQRYWRAHAGARDLAANDELLRRVVALATLTGATNEREAAELLRMIPDLADARAERRGELARWMHDTYPGGPDWWNPLEPDLLGEHLVATTFADSPSVIAAVMTRAASPRMFARSLTVLARIAVEYRVVRASLRPILSAALARMCSLAVAETASTREGDRPGGDATLAAALNDAIIAIGIEPEVLQEALECLPRSQDRFLDLLRLTLRSLRVDYLRALDATDGDA